MNDQAATSRHTARSWPYGTYSTFRSTVAETAAVWFAARRLEVDRRCPYILASRAAWPKNILVPDGRP